MEEEQTPLVRASDPKDGRSCMTIVLWLYASLDLN